MLHTNKKQCPTCLWHDRQLDPLPSTPPYSILTLGSLILSGAITERTRTSTMHASYFVVPNCLKWICSTNRDFFYTTSQSVYEYFLKKSSAADSSANKRQHLYVFVWVNVKPFLFSYCMLLNLLWTLHWSMLFQMKKIWVL